jgi:SAM-dependent methyltransferase
MSKLVFTNIDQDDLMVFLEDLLRDTAHAHQGGYLDPARFPPGFSNWPFVTTLNLQAYGHLSEVYHEHYFENKPLAQVFDAWMNSLPSGGQVLDAGCGHGDPVIARLLEHKFQVTGCDISPEMLQRARQQYPAATFWQCQTSLLDVEDAFDGVCSFSSMVYLDVVDFLHSVYRLYRALKPGGLLFLYGYDEDPGWRSSPYGIDLKRWMWIGYYAPEEIARMLEAHGYFDVTNIVKFLHPPAGETEEEGVGKKEEPLTEEPSPEGEDSLIQVELPDGETVDLPPFPKVLSSAPYDYVVIARKQDVPQEAL